jgi:hypothetical protein
MMIYKYASFSFLFLSSIYFSILNNKYITMIDAAISLFLPSIIFTLFIFYTKKPISILLYAGIGIILSKISLDTYVLIIDHSNVIKGKTLILLSWALVLLLYLNLLYIKLKDRTAI